MRETKALHPRALSEFSYRDYQTGWMHPEVRAYAWRYLHGGDVKHAIERAFLAYDFPEFPAGHVMAGTWTRADVTRTDYWRKNNLPSECGLWPDGPGLWIGSSRDPALYFDLPRCVDCLKAIGAPEIPPLRPHVTRAPRTVNRQFTHSPNAQARSAHNA